MPQGRTHRGTGPPAPALHTHTRTSAMSGLGLKLEMVPLLALNTFRHPHVHAVRMGGGGICLSVSLPGGWVVAKIQATVSQGVRPCPSPSHNLNPAAPAHMPASRAGSRPTSYRVLHIARSRCRALVALRGGMVILIFRPQTLLSGTRHAPGIIKYDSAPKLPSIRVYSHLRGLYSRLFLFLALFGRFWLGILLV